MEESSHSTPSPMSSAASSQDSLHRNAATLHYQQLHHQNPYGNLMTNTLPANTHLGTFLFLLRAQGHFLTIEVIQKPHGQDEVGRWVVKCPQLST